MDPFCRVIYNVLHCSLEVRECRSAPTEPQLAAKIIPLFSTKVAGTAWDTTLDSDSIADLELAIFTGRDDLARSFMAKAERLLDLDAAVLPVLVVVDVRAAECGGFHCNLDIVRI